MEPKITDKMVVGLTYTLKDDEGNLIEERSSDDPLLYIQGMDQIIPTIEECVDGQGVGFTAELIVQPEDYYGDYNEDLVADVDRAEFPSDMEIQIGTQFEIEGPEGQPLVAEVIEVSEDVITVDGNHPLAGVELHFNIRVESVREATREELDHGHVHNGDAHLH